MGSYRRWRQPGAWVFFTVVTYHRRPWFADPIACRLLGQCMRQCQAERPFETFAIALLPDHLHVVWRLPEGDCDYSTRWRIIKARFTIAARALPGWSAARSRSRERAGERQVWQRRFWERILRNEEDLKRHVDYLHYNPVKHGLATEPGLWPNSSFHKFQMMGEYDVDWGKAPRPELDRLPGLE